MGTRASTLYESKLNDWFNYILLSYVKCTFYNNYLHAFAFLARSPSFSLFAYFRIKWIMHMRCHRKSSKDFLFHSFFNNLRLWSFIFVWLSLFVFAFGHGWQVYLLTSVYFTLSLGWKTKIGRVCWLWQKVHLDFDEKLHSLKCTYYASSCR